MTIYDFAEDPRGTGRRRRLLMDEDFSWSDAPRRRRVVEAPELGSGTRRSELVAAERIAAHVAPAGGNAGVDSHDVQAVAVPSEGRRTIVITGHGAERNLPAFRRGRETSLRVHERSGFKPDRIALWAFLLALALLLGVTTSSHAAVLVHHLH